MTNIDEPMQFAAIYDDLGEPALIRVFGEIDIASAPEFEKAIQSASMRGVPFSIDLSACTYIDSSGLAALARAARRGNPITEVLVPKESKIVRVLEVTGMNALVPIQFITSELGRQFQS